MATFVTVWQWTAQGQAEFAAKRSGTDPWLSLGRATWSLPHEVGRHFAVVTCQWMRESCSIRCRRWSRIVAVYRGWSGSNGAARDPSWGVEQCCDRYCGLSGSGGAARNLPQEM